MKTNAKIKVLTSRINSETGELVIEKYKAAYSDCRVFGKMDFEEKEYRREQKEKKLAEMFANGKTLSEIEAEREKYNEQRRNSVRYDSMKRAKDRIYDLVLLNHFTHFVTITIDPKLLDSTDASEVMKKLSTWLNNLVKRYGLKYVLLPEYHKDGQKIHMHALFNDVLTYVDSGTRLFFYNGKKKPRKISTIKRYGGNPDECQIVYNLPQWTWGKNCTAIKIDSNVERVSNYVMKYITKGNRKIFGKYFWSSKNLNRKATELYMNVDFNRIAGNVYVCKVAGAQFKYRTNAHLCDDERQTFDDIIASRDINVSLFANNARGYSEYANAVAEVEKLRARSAAELERKREALASKARAAELRMLNEALAEQFNSQFEQRKIADIAVPDYDEMDGEDYYGF